MQPQGCHTSFKQCNEFCIEFCDVFQGADCVRGGEMEGELQPRDEQ